MIVLNLNLRNNLTMKPFKITLKLNEEASPHLYVSKIKELISDDNYLHPMLKGLLLTLKKARMPYARLSLEKEMVIVPKSHCHFERAISPSIFAWTKIEWTEEEIKEFEEEQKKYIKEVIKLQEKIGYDFFNKVEQTEEDIEDLEKIVKKKVKKRKFWQKK